MTTGPAVDGVLVLWGERLFYPASRHVKQDPTPRLDTLNRRKAAVIRQRIAAIVARRAPQAIVKVTGGGRGMGAIAAHLRYIGKNGRLPIEDDRGMTHEGKDALHDLVEQWRYSGSWIPQNGHRREAFNLMLSMPRGTDPKIVLKAAREFAQAELIGHRYVMVLHEHQANPHVHLSVKAEATTGKRLNPRKTDLHRWRETFAEKLRGWGIDAEATRQASRGANRRDEAIWRVKAQQENRLDHRDQRAKSGEHYQRSRLQALEAWMYITRALEASDAPEDKTLAQQVVRFVKEMPFYRETAQRRQRDAVRPDSQRTVSVHSPEVTTSRQPLNMER